MFAPKCIHARLFETTAGRASTNALIPRWPSSWPLAATNTTRRSEGGDAWRLRITSSQQAMPPPRSLAHVHQPLLGVITTSGGREASPAPIEAVTLSAVAALRFASATT